MDGIYECWRFSHQSSSGNQACTYYTMTKADSPDLLMKRGDSDQSDGEDSEWIFRFI